MTDIGKARTFAPGRCAVKRLGLIPGASPLGHLGENLAAAELALPSDVLPLLDRIAA